MTGGGIRIGWAVTVAVAAAVSARPAQAHLVNTDLGSFYGGALHPLTAPEHLLPILALALLAGQQGAATARRILLAFPLGLAAGAWSAFTFPGWTVAYGINLVSFLVFGVLVAGNWRLPQGVLEALALVFGATHGYANGGAAGVAGVSKDLFLAGLLTTGIVVVTVVPAFVLRLDLVWGRMAVRVVGSWIAAIGLLMIALMVRPAA